MPYKLKRLCAAPGCPKLTHAARCQAHTRENRQAYDQRRGSAHERGYTWQWQKYRAAYLQREPLCRSCKAVGRFVAARELDHIKPVSQGGSFWDPANHQPLCKPCHSAKTMREARGQYG